MAAIEGKKNNFFNFQDIGFQWSIQEDCPPPTGGLFASVGQMGVGGLGISNAPPRSTEKKIAYTDLYVKYVSAPELGRYAVSEAPKLLVEEEEEEVMKPKREGFKIKIKVKNHSLRRLISGGIAGAVSRTCVAPLETIRTHLMVGSSGNSTVEVFQSIMKTDGWKGLFRGNLINVIRVAPSKAIEAPDKSCADVYIQYIIETSKTTSYTHSLKSCKRKDPQSSTEKLYRKTFKKKDIDNIATLLIGSVAGAISSSATFPLEVARKHMQVGAVGGRQVYKNMLHALVSILEKEGIGGLYKGLGPSCMKLVPAAGISFMCYEACKKILIDNEDD
ncbi:hypothetical protein QJS10_CPA07g00702 [Acorus calamus]|uniref:Uncharacterized protein n=1 Tax=Acorus calamus TaxID=4465 RepID=A0AAV9EDB2_ACOCL|nr:hypothetical protein QJS10_CPA07g00702 [Acorus calamus]